MSTSLPVIRLDTNNKIETSQLLRKACIEYGFFYLVVGNDIITKEFLNNVFEQSHLLFACSEQSKKQCSNKTLSRGYTAMEEETLDPINQLKSGRGDTKEGYYIGRHVPIDSSQYNPDKLTGPNVWPTSISCPDLHDPTKFQSIMELYYNKMLQISIQTIRFIALALELNNENYFDQYFTDCMASTRLLHYAAVQSNPDDGLFACGAHSDYGMLTLLITDETPGLQIQTLNGEWMSVPPKPPSVLTSDNSSNENNDIYYVVNIGDMLERWTNGLFRSTIHRVVTVDCTRERYSIPFFLEPNFDTIVECLPTCCNSDDNLPKYEPITSGQHLINKYKQTHSDFTPSTTK